MENPIQLQLHVFPGASNRLELYEDDGETTAYREGAYAVTPFELEWSGKRLAFRIEPARGESRLLPKERSYEVIFHSLAEPEQIQVEKNGTANDVPCQYEASTGQLKLSSIQLRPDEDLAIRIDAKPGSLLLERDPLIPTLEKMLRAFRLHTLTKSSISERLAEIIEEPAQLGNYLVTLREAHLQALLEIISQAGVERLTNTGKEILLLWNNQADPSAQYQLSVNPIRFWKYSSRLSEGAGRVPKFIALSPAEEFRTNPWELRFHYDSLLNLRFRGGR